MATEELVGGVAMTKTDELRRMLDEHGAEYETEDRQTNMQTYWGDWCFMEPLDAKPHTLGAQCELMCIPATPEQAIAATLGNGECKLEPIPAIVVTLNMLNEIGWCKCSECGYATPEDSNYCQNCGKAVKR